MQGGRVRFPFAMLVDHLFGDPHSIEQGKKYQRNAGYVFDLQQGLFAPFSVASGGTEAEHQKPGDGSQADAADAGKSSEKIGCHPMM
jgi:hypothetical protein